MTTNKAISSTERSKAYEIILSGLKKMINEQTKGDSSNEGVPLPLEKQTLWTDPNEQIMSVDKNFDLLIEYIKEKQANRNVEQVLTKLKIAENAKQEYITLYNEIADELRQAKQDLKAKEHEIELLKLKISDSTALQEETLKNEVKELKKKQESELILKLKALETLNDDLSKKNEELEKSYKALNTTLEDQTELKQELSRVKQEYTDLKSKLSEQLEHKTELEAELEKVKEELEKNKGLETLTTLDESITFQEDTTFVEMESSQPPPMKISEKRVRFLHGLEATQQMLASMTASDRIKQESVPSVAEIREAKQKAVYQTFLNNVKTTHTQPNLVLLREFLFNSTYYDSIRVPQNITHSQDWQDILFRSFNKLTEEELSEKREEIEESYFVLSTTEFKVEYDLVLKTVRLLKDSFFTLCFEVQVKKTKGKRKDLVKVKSERKFVILNSNKKRIYVLNKQVEKYPTHLHRGEKSFRLKDIVSVKEARRGELNTKKVSIRSKKFDEKQLQRIVEVEFKFKEKKQKLFMLVDTNKRMNEVLITLQKLKQIYSN